MMTELQSTILLSKRNLVLQVPLFIEVNIILSGTAVTAVFCPQQIKMLQSKEEI